MGIEQGDGSYTIKFSDGSKITCKIRSESNLANKEFFSLFDSLGSGCTWQTYLSELTGMAFDQ